MHPSLPTVLDGFLHPSLPTVPDGSLEEGPASPRRVAAGQLLVGAGAEARMSWLEVGGTGEAVREVGAREVVA